MSKTDYQFNDVLNFLSEVSYDYLDFVMDIHDKLTQMGCKFKVSSNKTYPFKIAYTMPNS